MGVEVTFQVIGINEFMARIERFIVTNTVTVRTIVLKNAMELQSEAKKRAKIDTGNMANRIRVTTEDAGLTGVVIANATYSAFVEFGTRGGVSVPSGYEDLASMFKGHGRGMPPYKKLKGWASRHSMSGKEFLIARAIARNGTKPQPFLIPSYEEQKPKFIIDVTKAFKKLEGELNG